MSLTMSFPSCDLKLVVCFVFPAILINRTVLVAYFPLWSGLETKVHFAPSAPWTSETPPAPQNSFRPPSPSIFKAVSSTSKSSGP